MHTTTVLLTLAALLAAAHAADVVEGAVNCPVLGATGDQLDWDYDTFHDETGPKNWHKKFKECAGKHQSPVDFPLDVMVAPKAKGPVPSLGSIKVTAAGTNNNFALVCPEAGTCGHTMMDGVNYTVANGHFHSPSEHTLNGIRYPLELHIVHANPTATKFLVLAIMFQTPPESSYQSQVHQRAGRDWCVNPLLKETLSHVSGGGSKPEFGVPLSSVVEADKGFCSYDGSLTTPPCTEAVTFYMSMHVPIVSKAQVNQYKVAAGAAVHGNARPLQSINGRNVTCYIM